MRIEVAIPCYNEEGTVRKVVADFRAAIPGADVVVYDNLSKDRTAEVAAAAGARVVRVKRRGKGYVVQEVFASSKADIVVLVDGDDTYEAADAGLLVNPILTHTADMTIGTRLHSNRAEFRKMHHFGNRFLTWSLNAMFGSAHGDILSGYRAFGREFRDSIPLTSTGFEIETELVIQALSNGMTVLEVPVRFRDRPPGSLSKLSTLRDGYRILMTMIRLLRDHRPLFTFSLISLVALMIATPLWVLGVMGHVPPIWRTIGALLVQLAVGLTLVGFILNTINTRVRELASLLLRRDHR